LVIIIAVAIDQVQISTARIAAVQDEKKEVAPMIKSNP